MLMPVLVYQYGPKEAVPIMAIAAVMAHFSRVLAWWRVDAGHRTKGPDRRELADVRRLHRQTFRATHRAGRLSIVDGRHHGGRRPQSVVDGIFFFVRIGRIRRSA